MTGAPGPASGRVRGLPGRGLDAVPGLRCGAAAAGIKPGDAGLDVALLVAERPLACAGVFTRSRVVAAPVVVCRESLARRPEARAVVINSGNANAVTGWTGEEHARRMIARVEERCGGPALVLSTGVIGQTLPIDRVLSGIDGAAADLAASPEAAARLADAVRTTDTRPKSAAVRVVLPAHGGEDEREVTVAGVAKGSGMIHPDMATMLAVLATDAPVEPPALDALLRRAVDRSFHRITVDGDTSTNDAVLLLAGGADAPPLGDGDPRLAVLEEGVAAVAHSLALQIVEDGEGATRVLEMRVTGAASAAEARAVAHAIARSPLVKTALAGGDPNWGRFLMAAGNAGVPIDTDRVTLRLGGVAVFARGVPDPTTEEAAQAAFGADRVVAELDLDRGAAEDSVYTTDLSHGYVRINADYRS